MISTTSSETTVFSAVLALFADADPTIRPTETNKHFLNMFHLARLLQLVHTWWTLSLIECHAVVSAMPSSLPGDGGGRHTLHPGLEIR